MGICQCAWVFKHGKPLLTYGRIKSTQSYNSLMNTSEQCFDLKMAIWRVGFNEIEFLSSILNLPHLMANTPIKHGVKVKGQTITFWK